MSRLRLLRVFVVVSVFAAFVGTMSGCSGSYTVDVKAKGETEADETAAAQPASEAAPAQAASTPKPAPKPKPVPPPPPPAPTYTTVTTVVPAGTSVAVAFDSELSSETSQIGDSFSCAMTNDVAVDGEVVIPAGSVVHGTVTDAVPTKKIGGQASLTLTFERVELPDGTSAPLVATMVSVGKKQTGKDAGTIAGSTAGGALLGRLIEKKKKDKATAIGAAVGAAVGTAIAAKNESDPVLIEPGAVAEILTEQAIEFQKRVRAS